MARPKISSQIRFIILPTVVSALSHGVFFGQLLIQLYCFSLLEPCVIRHIENKATAAATAASDFLSTPPRMGKSAKSSFFRNFYAVSDRSELWKGEYR